MRTIDKLFDAIARKDYEALADLFDEDGIFIDYCAVGARKKSYHIYGREAINMFFRNRFTFRRYSIVQPLVLDDQHANCVASYDGYLVAAFISIRSMTEDGHIRRLAIRPK